MKAKTIHLFFLILTGLIIGWREWTNTTTFIQEELVVNNWQEVQEVGSTAEASIVLLLFFLGAISVFVMNGYWQASPRLSSPNSV